MRFLITILFICLFSISFAQTEVNVTTVSLGFGEQAQKSFWLKGEQSKKFVNQIWDKYGKGVKRSYISKFSGITINGIDGLIKLRVQEGVYGAKNNDQCSGSYFNTFTSEKYRNERISRMTENEQFGIIIYVKKEKRQSINSDEEASFMIDFIRNLIQDKN